MEVRKRKQQNDESGMRKRVCVEDTSHPEIINIGNWMFMKHLPKNCLCVHEVTFDKVVINDTEVPWDVFSLGEIVETDEGVVIDDVWEIPDIDIELLTVARENVQRPSKPSRWFRCNTFCTLWLPLVITGVLLHISRGLIGWELINEGCDFEN